MLMPAATMARAWLAAAGKDAAAKVGCLFGDMLVARRAGWTPLKVAQRQFKAYGSATQTATGRVDTLEI